MRALILSGVCFAVMQVKDGVQAQQCQVDHTNDEFLGLLFTLLFSPFFSPSQSFLHPSGIFLAPPDEASHDEHNKHQYENEEQNHDNPHQCSNIHCISWVATPERVEMMDKVKLSLASDIDRCEYRVESKDLQKYLSDSEGGRNIGKRLVIDQQR